MGSTGLDGSWATYFSQKVPYAPSSCFEVRFAVEKSESFAGKLMGYSGVRVPNGEASLWLKRFYESLEGTGGKMVPTKADNIGIPPPKGR